MANIEGRGNKVKGYPRASPLLRGNKMAVGPKADTEPSVTHFPRKFNLGQNRTRLPVPTSKSAPQMHAKVQGQPDVITEIEVSEAVQRLTRDRAPCTDGIRVGCSEIFCI